MASALPIKKLGKAVKLLLINIVIYHLSNTRAQHGEFSARPLLAIKRFRIAHWQLHIAENPDG